MAGGKTIQDVVPAGAYGLVRSDRVAGVATADPADYVAACAAAGLKGLVFQLWDSTYTAMSWQPDAASVHDAYRVQALLVQPGFLDALKAAGLAFGGYSYVGAAGRTSSISEARAARYIQELGGTCYVYDVTDPVWNADPALIFERLLARTAERMTILMPIFLRAPRLASARPADVWRGFNSDGSILRSFPMPTLGHAEMDAVSYKASYDSYNVASQSQLLPALEYCLDLRTSPDPTEVANILQLFGSNNGPTGPNTGGGITLVVGNWTPTVGFVLVDDLELLSTLPGISDTIAASTPPPKYWDYDYADGGAATLIRLQVFCPEYPDPLPIPVVGQAWSMTVEFNSMRKRGWGWGKPSLFSVRGWRNAPGLNADPTWIHLSAGGGSYPPVYFGNALTFSGTAPDTRPSVLELREVDSNIFGVHMTQGLAIVITPANAGNGGNYPARVQGASIWPAGNGLDPDVGAVTVYPPVMVASGAGMGFMPGIVHHSPWDDQPPGSVAPPTGDGGGGGYLFGPSVVFPTCGPPAWSANIHLLNHVYTTVKGYAEFQADPSDLLDFWALLIAIAHHESGWTNVAPSWDCSDGFLQLRTFSDPGCLNAEIPAQGGMGNYHTMLELEDPDLTLALAGPALYEGIAHVRAAAGKWDNDLAIQEGFGASNAWAVVRPEIAIATYHCIRAFVKSQTWPLPESSGGGPYGPPAECSTISCDFGCYAGHVGIDFSCGGGSNFAIDHSDPDPANWTATYDPPTGGAILAVADGTITALPFDPASDFNATGNWMCAASGNSNPSGWGIGYYIVLVPDDNPNLRFRYCHFNRPEDISVTVGQHVTEGSHLAPGMGSRGCASGTHLHFEAQEQIPPGSGTWRNQDPHQFIG